MNIYIQKDGRQQGPFPLEEINAKALRGELGPSDPAWIEGWAQWQLLSSVPGFVPGPDPSALTPQAPPPPRLDAASAPPKPESVFLYIPVSRLVVMSILTLGLYEAYLDLSQLALSQGARQPFYQTILEGYFWHILHQVAIDGD